MTTLLVVDDESLVTDFLSFLFRREGYVVHAARTGREALDVIGRERPDLIVTDLMMPVMSGVELATALRQDERLAHLPIVLCTAAPHALANEDRALFVAVLHKPYPPATLLDVVARHVGASRT
ncbi:response regulator [Paraburkholderia kururiensis]|uniref:Response regulator n=1 Tax=Paraburkholderia kururiensis TaxID=984307 RepID=A0ABZ0WLN0_9BURK|nr:response regulator [Paraburkholderia kururiensis]WQD78181.1 response regulator [Paraburkholderia kururiensis]